MSQEFRQVTWDIFFASIRLQNNSAWWERAKINVSWHLFKPPKGACKVKKPVDFRLFTAYRIIILCNHKYIVFIALFSPIFSALYKARNSPMSMNFETQWWKAVIFRTYQDFAIVIYTYLYNKYSHISSIPTHFQLVFDEGSGKNWLLLNSRTIRPLYT